MKKNWGFVILSVAVLFSLGFMPAPGGETANGPLLNPANSISVELSVNNKSTSMAIVNIGSTQPYFAYSFYVPKGTKVTKSIKVEPGKYRIIVGLGDNGCKSIAKNIEITKKTKKINLSFECGKFR
jgi:hypothetical protein